MVDVILSQFRILEDEPPLGLLYLANALEKGDYSVKILHVFPEEAHKIEEAVKEHNPLFLGMSTFTTPAILDTIKISKAVKSKFKIPVVWGGVHPSLFPKTCLEQDYIDVVVVGEGEPSITEVAKRIRKKESFEGIPGVGYKEKREIKINPPGEFYKNLDDYEPSWHLLDVESYFAKKWGKEKILSIVTSRGCPYRCAFCWNVNFYKRYWRGHSADKVIEQVKFLKEKYNIDGVDFIDSNFFTDRKRAEKIIRNIGVSWGVNIRAREITEESIKLFKETDCRELLVGAESGSQRVLDIIKKDIKVEDIINAARLCDEYGVLGKFSFLVGIPGEQKQDIQQTLDLITKLKENYRSIRINGPKVFTPYPGAELYEKAIELGFKPPEEMEKWAEFTRNKCHLPWIKNKSVMESLQMVSQIAHSNPKSIIGKAARKIEGFRWKHNFFYFPLEIQILYRMQKNPKTMEKLIKLYGDKGRELIK